MTAPTLVKIHKVTGTMPATDASEVFAFDDAETLGDINKSFLFFTYRNSDAAPQEMTIKATISSTTQITLTRFSAAGAASEFVAYVCEFSAAVVVARGSQEFGGSTVPIDVDLSGTFAQADLGTLAVFCYAYNKGSTYGFDDPYTAQIIDDGSKLVLRITGTVTTLNSDRVLDWEVVQYGTGADAWSVTQGNDAGMASGDASEVDSGLSAVDTEKTFLITHCRHVDNITVGDMGEAMIRGVMDSGTQNTYHRGDTGIAITDISWQRVEFVGNETVQNFSEAFVATDAVETTTLGTALSDVTKAAAIGSFRGYGGSCDMVSDDVYGEAVFAIEITGTTTVVSTRNATVSAADLEGYVIDFGAAAAAEIITIIAAAMSYSPQAIKASSGVSIVAAAMAYVPKALGLNQTVVIAAAVMTYVGQTIIVIAAGIAAWFSLFRRRRRMK